MVHAPHPHDSGDNSQPGAHPQSRPDIASCLRHLDQANANGAWLPASLYPHEHAEIIAHTLRAAGFSFEAQRQMFTVAGPSMQALGTNSAMVYAYALAEIEELPGVRLGLSGGVEGDEAIQAELLQRTRDPQAYIKSAGEWSVFEVPSLQDYGATTGRLYTLSAEQAASLVAQGATILDAKALAEHTPQPNARMRSTRL